MIHKKTIKAYVYQRDQGKCFHCGKSIRFNQTTLDHYFPKSRGGTEEFFNLVACCKFCNRMKKSVVPKDWLTINIELFKKAVLDGKVISQVEPKYNQDELVGLAHGIESIFRNKINTVFEGDGYRLYVKENKIYKMVRFHHEEE
ncbi:HNH endonuclease [Fusibacter ferrireducens]|uniref:HNH endonuclease n=1 Tax=Fusibacter ferrireducens TaxID=2785058 RepID=A0ABR9ZS78_9FIRM|nr:HNH endonuclease [Fusibacter ferrireducens]MBF4693314.1 HNH endonuclease [Fusibacter ferrireducens]